MKIVIFDGSAVNPGDISWEPLQALGECVIYEYTEKSQIIERAHDAEVIITNKTPLYRTHIDALPKLQYIGLLSTGYNVVDIEYAKARNIPVCNVPAYSTMSVAQHVFALLLELTQHTAAHAESVRQGKWAKHTQFCYWEEPVHELDGRTMGILGFGNIGQAVARIAEAFGMKVIVHTRTPQTEEYPSIQFVDLQMLFRESDVVSLHAPLTEKTKGLVGEKYLSLMKETAYLINASRGAVVVEADLARALHEGQIAGAGLDVLAHEPPSAENPLLSAPRTVITPHLAWASKAARIRVVDIAAANLRGFFEGTPQNVVNG